jgi:NAD(P)H dehydrogenase (quinone)
MKHLIVVAHPIEDSFTMALVRAYAFELQQLGHNRRIYDLYRMGFNPILEPNELVSASADLPALADVVQAQRDLRSSDVLTVVYPLWWLSMPAIMKGYIDRVFARGFAYDVRDGVVHGLLTGKKCVLVTASGAPLPLLMKSGGWNAVQVLQDSHVFRSAGFELLEHLHFDEVVPGLPETIAKRHIARVQSCARQHFSAVGSEQERFR